MHADAVGARSLVTPLEGCLAALEDCVTALEGCMAALEVQEVTSRDVGAYCPDAHALGAAISLSSTRSARHDGMTGTLSSAGPCWAERTSWSSRTS
ncbi:hypothetical protein [Chondromyces crocatus]|uniref:Uncharacterized protein n=1 Tax=Chondromyces crocatus TaxID=52 RepID=A0A0K1EAT5_CHOCO|nr:hypothetical protein [Chondromyces crocatus]AKT37980.1 uncharacterized protein CMC5_021210 [Chondromyces crocatus]